MSIKTLYPNTLSQTSGNNIQTFNNLNNLKNSNATYAKTGQIAKKSGTKKTPASIIAKNFKAHIPTGSKINKVTVEYAADYEGNISIGKTTLNPLKMVGENKHGKALTKTMTKTSVTWVGGHYVSTMNHVDFGVKISFPANTKDDTGYVKLKYIRIIIDYTPPNFSLTSQHISGTYKDEEHLIKLTLSNVNKTNSGSNVNLQLPSGLGFIRQDSGDGVIYQNPGGSNSPVSLGWRTEIGNKSSVSVVLRLYPETNGAKTINWNETGSGHSGSFSFNVEESPHLENPEVPMNTPEPQVVTNTEATPTVNPDPYNIIQVAVNEEFSLDLTFDDYSGSNVHIYAYHNDYTYDIMNGDVSDKVCIYLRHHGTGVMYWENVMAYDRYNELWSPLSYVLTGGMSNLFKISVAGYYSILIYSSDENTLLKKILVCVRPDNLDLPHATVLKLTQEEHDRLGHEKVYTVQSYMKLITDELFAREWGKNFKIGVFNNISDEVITLASFGSFSNDSVTTTLTLPTGVVDYAVSTEPEVTISQSSNTIVFTKDEDSNINVLIDFLDNEDNIVCTGEYLINFDDETVTIMENDYDSTDYENLTTSELVEYAEYWSAALPNVNEFISNTVEFPFNKNYPVYILITGDYPEENPFGNDIQFTEPCVIESRVYNGPENNGNFPIPIMNLIKDSDSSEIDLKLFEKGNTVAIYQFPVESGFGTNDKLAITGIELNGDILFADQVTLSAKLCNPDGDFGERSIIINADSTDDIKDSFSIGGKYDLWTFKVSDMVNLENWWIEITLHNVFDNENDLAEVQLKNLRVTISMNKIESQLIGCCVDGENIAHYMSWLDEVEIPEGLETDTKYLDIDGTDTNDAYRMNIKSKEITLKIAIEGCTIQETTNLLRQLARLFVNDRDELNRPIPKRIEFSHYPDVYFLYILEDAFDSDVTAAYYDTTIKLTIPSGTAFAKEDTVTGHVGVNSGLAKVNPIITLIPTGDLVEITELKTNQKFKITCSYWTSENIVEIDCINRTITILNYEDGDTTIEKNITEEGDLNNDWFILHREYEFQQDNCIIQTVKFTERR